MRRTTHSIPRTTPVANWRYDYINVRLDRHWRTKRPQRRAERLSYSRAPRTTTARQLFVKQATRGRSPNLKPKNMKPKPANSRYEGGSLGGIHMNSSINVWSRSEICDAILRPRISSFPQSPSEVLFRNVIRHGLRWQDSRAVLPTMRSDFSSRIHQPTQGHVCARTDEIRRTIEMQVLRVSHKMPPVTFGMA